jgi:anaerobic magnesium-protoporphyrin IX monomethyl ester cyclase
MAKVLWIQNLWMEFYGVMVVSGLLKEHGHQSEIVFGTKEEIVESIKRDEPNCIAFSCMTVQWKWAKEISTFIKQSGIEIPIVMGGVHATMYPDDAISHPDIDIICLNEGEYPMLELMEAFGSGQDYSTIENLWIRQNDKIIKNSTRPKLIDQELNDLPFADRKLYKKYDHFANYPFEIFVGSRGCPFKCSFCEVPDINALYGDNRKSTYYRDPVAFVDEIEIAKEKGLLDGKLTMFTDSTFNSHKKWFLQFLDEYKRRIAMPFSCNLRVDLVDEVQVKALADTGCCDNVRFGVESGDYDIRNQILDKNLTDEQIHKVSDLLHKYKVPFVTFNLFGSPEETYEQAWKTIHINQRINPSGASAYVVMLYPGIRMTENAIDKGLINKGDLDLLDEHPYNIHRSLLELHPEKSPDAVRISNLCKFSLLAMRLPFLEPIIRLLVKLPPLDVFNTIYSISSAWEYRKWSSRTTFWRLVYEGILNYQALVIVQENDGSILRKISVMFSNWTKKRRQTPSINIKPGVLETFRQ